ncbi:MAG TPA: DJ-1/PfpI family protein [Candidatus Desulfofervidus auxilii]|uniref:DJ-1/PfpI family protein n=1 Tax=Desulfofervidus auxilii TaxID=1621989 RepID=A0A7C0Y3G5_DESA2|nr:DJ-1/PfpI family protein [Candidatus Desulfofervidus auxilii]
MKKIILMVLFLFVWSNVFSNDVKIVMIIAENNFRDEELFVTKEVLEEKGAKVIVASTSLTPAKGMLGRVYKPDILLKDIEIDDYDAIIFVGGIGATQYWNDKTAHKLIKEALEKDKVIAAICIAPVTLANAGILKGKKATVWPSEARALEKAGAIYTGKSVEKDGKIITANGPHAAKAFGETIAATLGL